MCQWTDWLAGLVENTVFNIGSLSAIICHRIRIIENREAVDFFSLVKVC